MLDSRVFFTGLVLSLSRLGEGFALDDLIGVATGYV